MTHIFSFSCFTVRKIQNQKKEEEKYHTKTSNLFINQMILN